MFGEIDYEFSISFIQINQVSNLDLIIIHDIKILAFEIKIVMEKISQFGKIQCPSTLDFGLQIIIRKSNF